MSTQVAPVQTLYDSSSPSDNWSRSESFLILNCFHLWHLIGHAGTPCTIPFLFQVLGWLVVKPYSNVFPKAHFSEKLSWHPTSWSEIAAPHHSGIIPCSAFVSTWKSHVYFKSFLVCFVYDNRSSMKQRLLVHSLSHMRHVLHIVGTQYIFVE